MNVETRKLQQVGHSTLMISLPKEWVRSTGLSQGDTLTIQQNDDGTLNILPIGVSEKKDVIKCMVDADKCDKGRIISRIITGVYIIGHETLEITSKKGFNSEQLAEIRQSIQRLTGMSIVEQDMTHIIIKNFVDPTRFPTNGLLRRIYIITSWMQEAAIQALKECRSNLAAEVIHMENEVDRIYWLVVRQMFLAVKDKAVEKKIGIESPIHLIGDRTIAKVLEKIGDLAEGIAQEVLTVLDNNYPLEISIVNDLDKMFKLIHDVYAISTKAFFTTDLIKANEALENVKDIMEEQKKLTASVLENLRNSMEATKGEIIYSGVNTYIALRAILWNFAQIVGYCGTISEITINRALEKPSAACGFERVVTSEA